MKEYPTQKQKYYIDDLIQFLIRYIEFISEDLIEEYLDNDSLKTTDKFESINNNKETQNIIGTLNRVCAELGSICNMLNKSDKISCDDAIVRFNLKMLKRDYEKLMEYIILPSYEELKQRILEE